MTQRTGKEIIADMEIFRDVVHERILQRLQDECTHDYPLLGSMCLGCNRIPPALPEIMEPCS